MPTDILHGVGHIGRTTKKNDKQFAENIHHVSRKIQFLELLKSLAEFGKHKKEQQKLLDGVISKELCYCKAGFLSHVFGLQLIS